MGKGREGEGSEGWAGGEGEGRRGKRGVGKECGGRGGGEEEGRVENTRGGGGSEGWRGGGMTLDNPSFAHPISHAHLALRPPPPGPHARKQCQRRRPRLPCRMDGSEQTTERYMYSMCMCEKYTYVSSCVDA